MSRGSSTHRPSTAVAGKLRDDQTGKLARVYEAAKATLDSVWILATTNATPETLRSFDEQVQNVRTITGDLGKSEKLNGLFNKLPLSVSTAVAAFCEATRYAYWSRIGDKPGALEKKAVALGLMNELLRALSSRENKARRRLSKTTLDINTEGEQRSSQSSGAGLTNSSAGFPGVRVGTEQPQRPPRNPKSVLLSASVGSGLAVAPRREAPPPRALGKPTGKVSLLELVARFPTEDLTKRLTMAKPGQVDSVDSNGRTALHVAVALDRREQVKILLAFRCNPNLLDRTGFSPLLIAAHKGNFECVKLLLDVGADANLCKEGKRPMEYLLQHNPTDVSQCAVFGSMIEHGVSVNSRYRHDQSILAFAVAYRNPTFVALLLAKRGIEIDAQNKFGETPLHIAARLGDAELIKMLIKAGANLAIEGSSGKPSQVLKRGCPNRLTLQKMLLPPKGSGAGIASPRDLASVEPRITDTLRRIGTRANGNRGGGDAFAFLNELLQEAAEKEDIASPPVRRAVPPLSSGVGNRYSDSTSTIQSGRAEKHLCSECNCTLEGGWYRMVSLGETEKRFLCTGCVSVLRNRAQSATKAVVASPALTPGRHLVVAPSSSLMLRVEPPESVGKSFPPRLEDVFEPYRNFFFSKAHWCFASRGSQTLVAVSITAKEGFHKCLAFSPSGHLLHEAKEEIILSLSGKTLRDKFFSYVKDIWCQGVDWYQIPDEKNKMFQLELLGLEVSHAANANAFRLGVVHWSELEGGEEKNFKTRVVSQNFQTFLDLIGETVQINSFSGYAGGFEDIASVASEDKTSYYTSWMNLEIMYHVAPLLNADEQRRLLGNDLVLIIFNESPSNVFPPYAFRGNVNSIGIVVRQISAELYTVGCFCRSKVKEFGPRGGIEVPASELRNFLLTKAINGILSAQKSPPFAQMISRLFSEDIEQILDKHVPKGTSQKRGAVNTSKR